MGCIDRELNIAKHLFNLAVAPFVQDRHERLAFIDPWKGSPRWIRERDALNKLWTDQTAKALELLAVTEAEIKEHGEMTEATADAWDLIIPREILNTDHLDNRRRVVVPEPMPVDGRGVGK